MRLIYQVRRGARSKGEYEKIGEYGFEELRSLYLAGVLKDTDLFSIKGTVDRWTRIEKLFPKESLADGVKSRHRLTFLCFALGALVFILVFHFMPDSVQLPGDPKYIFFRRLFLPR
jgi:VIT1/CCC1 family predicted Fe2+/Mn2+ transporter